MPWLEIEARPRHVAKRVAMVDGRPVVHDGHAAWISLIDGSRLDATPFHGPVEAVEPRGRGVLCAQTYPTWTPPLDRWWIDATGQRHDLPDETPIGFLDEDRLTVGKRARFRVLEPRRGGSWASPMRPKPALHLTKEHFSGGTNWFRWVHGRGSGRLLSVAEVDAVLWAWPGHGPPTAPDATTFFSFPALSSSHPVPPRWLDPPPYDGLRQAAPALVLGPSDEFAYALGHDAVVFRVTEEATVRFEIDPTFSVWRLDHTEIRRAPGRLLAGYGDHITGEHEGRLFRERLSTGDRDDLGPPGAAITHAVALVGTPHVVVFEAAESLRVRFV